MTTTFTNETEDLDLMQALTGRSTDALEQLHRRYRPILKSIVYQVVHDDAESEDVLQDVFLQVWERAKNYSAQKGKVVNWLATLARRRAIDRLRQKGAYRRATDRFEEACETGSHEAVGDSFAHHDAEKNDLMAFLRTHLDALPEQQHRAIEMAYLENRSQREISALTGTPLGTVKTRIELGMKKLAKSVGSVREAVI